MKKHAVLSLIVCMAVLLTGCYHIETTDTEQYADFYQRMKVDNTSVGKYIPEPSDTFTVEDVYLYYSDWDPVDSMYAVYVNCVYTTEHYGQAKDAAYAVSRKWGDPVSNSPSFDCESVIGTQRNDISKGGTNQYAYILFDDTERRIVHVYLFEDATKRTSKHIPQQYLPKELRAVG